MLKTIKYEKQFQGIPWHGKICKSLKQQVKISNRSRSLVSINSFYQIKVISLLNETYILTDEIALVSLIRLQITVPMKLIIQSPVIWDNHHESFPIHVLYENIRGKHFVEFRQMWIIKIKKECKKNYVWSNFSTRT